MINLHGFHFWNSKLWPLVLMLLCLTNSREKYFHSIFNSIGLSDLIRCYFKFKIKFIKGLFSFILFVTLLLSRVLIIWIPIFYIWRHTHTKIHTHIYAYMIVWSQRHNYILECVMIFEFYWIEGNFNHINAKKGQQKIIFQNLNLSFWSSNKIFFFW